MDVWVYVERNLEEEQRITGTRKPDESDIVNWQMFRLVEHRKSGFSMAANPIVSFALTQTDPGSQFVEHRDDVDWVNCV